MCYILPEGASCPASTNDVSKSIADDPKQLEEARAARMLLSRCFFNYTPLSSQQPGKCPTGVAERSLANCRSCFDNSITFTLSAVDEKKAAGSRFTDEELLEHACARPGAFQRLWKNLMYHLFPPQSAFFAEAQRDIHVQALVFLAIDTVSL